MEKVENNKEQFESEFCHVTYDLERRMVLFTWKKFACGENYRKPCRFTWELFKKYPLTYLVIDARNGFEDEPEDVEWGFSEFLPGMATTKCEAVYFIMEEVSDIEEEMDMWGKEISKYFELIKVTSYEEVIRRIGIDE